MKLRSREIKLIMARSLLTQQKLSDLSGLSRQSISTILCRGSCSVVNAGRLAAALGVDVEEIAEV